MDTLERVQWRAAEVIVLEHLPYEEKLRELFVQPEEGSGEISSIYIYVCVNTWRGVQRRQSQALSSVPRDKTRGHRHKMKHRRFCLNIRKVFALWGWWGTASGCPGGWWVLPPCRYAKAIWTWSWASGSGWPCFWAGRLSQMTSRGPFQCQLFCDLVILPLCGLCGKELEPAWGSEQWPQLELY